MTAFAKENMYLSDKAQKESFKKFNWEYISAGQLYGLR
jgi:hypothetical protein